MVSGFHSNRMFAFHRSFRLMLFLSLFENAADVLTKCSDDEMVFKSVSRDSLPSKKRTYPVFAPLSCISDRKVNALKF